MMKLVPSCDSLKWPKMLKSLKSTNQLKILDSLIFFLSMKLSCLIIPLFLSGCTLMEVFFKIYLLMLFSFACLFAQIYKHGYCSEFVFMVTLIFLRDYLKPNRNSRSLIKPFFPFQSTHADTRPPFPHSALLRYLVSSYVRIWSLTKRYIFY